ACERLHCTEHISQLSVFCLSRVAVIIFLFNISDITMPKDKQPLSRRLKTLSSEFGEDVFSIDNVVLFCKLCEVQVDPERRSSIIQHIKTEKHRRAVERQINQKTKNS
ncbi:CGG triplet repeat-binding protein 1-like, partial [Aphis craccivora]